VAAEVPFAFVAVTLKVYAVAEANPVNVIGDPELKDPVDGFDVAV
jgi:hypothetical protein